MKRSPLIAVLVAVWFIAACSSGTDGPGPDTAATGTAPQAAGTAATGTVPEAAGTGPESVAVRLDALAKSDVPMPGADVEAVDPGAIAAATQAAAAAPGPRGAFQTFHDSVSPLRPVASLRLAAASPTEICVGLDGAASGGACPGADPGGGGGQVDPVACPRVCSTACASANATAVAAAFAHASAQACAFAQAWACVYESVAPFGRVCAWARSQACASSFATAFGFGFAVANDQECRTVCSDGTVTVTNGPPPANGAVPAAKSLLRPNT